MLLRMNGVLLVLETSGREASAALWVDGVLIDSKKWESDRRQSAHLFAPVGELLQLLHGRMLDTILVGAGPGSYGGVRAALAAADGIALVHGACVVSLCSWESVAAGRDVAWVISDARRNGWAAGLFREGRLQGEIIIIEGGEMKGWIEERKQAREIVLSVETQDAMQSTGWEGLFCGLVPSAELLGNSWQERTAEERQVLMETRPAPIYVRPPHITAAKRPAWMVERGN